MQNPSCCPISWICISRAPTNTIYYIVSCFPHRRLYSPKWPNTIQRSTKTQEIHENIVKHLNTSSQQTKKKKKNIPFGPSFCKAVASWWSRVPQSDKTRSHPWDFFEKLWGDVFWLCFFWVANCFLIFLYNIVFTCFHNSWTPFAWRYSSVLKGKSKKMRVQSLVVLCIWKPPKSTPTGASTKTKRSNLPNRAALGGFCLKDSKEKTSTSKVTRAIFGWICDLQTSKKVIDLGVLVIDQTSHVALFRKVILVVFFKWTLVARKHSSKDLLMVLVSFKLTLCFVGGLLDIVKLGILTWRKLTRHNK